MKQTKAIKTEVLFTRVELRTMRAFESEAQARGLSKCEAVRQIIAAWLREPEVMPIGLPPQVE